MSKMRSSANVIPTDRIFDYPMQAMCIGTILQDKAQQNGDKTFLHYLEDGSKYSYADVDRLSNSLAHGFLGHGVGKGAHVGILMENRPEFLVACFALGKIGAIAVPLHNAARGDLLAYFINQAEISVIVCEAKFLPRLAEIEEVVGRVSLITVLPDGSEPSPQPTGKQCEVVDFSLLYAPRSDSCGIEVKFSDPAFMLFTSGTTGPSKVIVQNSVRAYGTALFNFNVFDYKETDVFYLPLSLAHGASLQSAAFLALMGNAELALAKRFSVSSFWDDIARADATAVLFLSSMSHFLWNQPQRPNDADNSLRIVATAPVPTFAADFERRFGVRIASAYGLSDFGPITTFTHSDSPEKLGSSGRPRFCFDVRIADENDFELPSNSIGELLVRCNIPWLASSGYYNMPEADVRANRNGWFHTGDRAYLDADGYLWFVDREKDCIRRRGENVSSYEVEKVIMSHSAVLEAAVVGVDADDVEEEICAAVVLRHGAEVSEEQLVEHCSRNLSYFMVPRFVLFVDGFPRTASQRIEKYKLRESIDRKSLWDREAAGVVVKRD